MCGFANLNGIRYTCDELDALKQDNTAIMWMFRYHPLNVQMKLRPRDYPDYEAGFQPTVSCTPATLATDAATTGASHETTEAVTTASHESTVFAQGKFQSDRRRMAGTFGGSAQMRVVKDLFL